MTPPRLPYSTHDRVLTERRPAWPTAEGSVPSTLDSLTTHDSGSTVGPLSAAVALPPPPARTRQERLASLVDEFLALRRARRDSFRRQCAIVHQIKSEALWGGTARDFDAWAWRVLHLDRGAVTRMIAIAIDPIGGAGRRPGRKPGGPAAGGSRAHSPGARAQMGEVEGIRETAIVSTSSDGAPTAQAFLGWAARQLERLEQHGVAGRVAGLSHAERDEATRVFAGLRDFFACCAAEAAAGEEDPIDA